MGDDMIKEMAEFGKMLCEVGAGGQVVELNSLWIKKIIDIYIEVPGDEELYLG